MRNARVPLFGNPLKSVTVNPAATDGAVIGKNLIGPDGKLVSAATWKRLLSGATGGSQSAIGTTDDLDEGRWNLYFTDRRAQDAVGEILEDSDNVTLTYGGDPKTIKADLTDVTVTAGGALKKYGFDAKGRLSESDNATTDDLPEGDRLYFTPMRAAQAAMAPIHIPDESVFSIPDGSQCLFSIPIDVDGALDVSGALMEVS